MVSDEKTIIHICRPSAIAVTRRVMHCPVCRSRHRFTVIDNGWYGSDLICHNCGNRFWPGEGYRKIGKKEQERNRELARSGWASPFDRSDEFWDAYMEKV